jgi:hypothetical protein
LFPALFLGAQQSFYISPGQTIGNGDIVRGYCLEFAEDMLSNDNITGLVHKITGMVRVVYASKAPENLKLQFLVSNGLVRFNAFNSYQYVQFFFTGDSGIREITVLGEGLGLFRDGITAAESALVRNSIKTILALEARNLAHSAIQEYIWKTLPPLDTDKNGVRTIDFQTTSAPARQVHTQFGGNATVDYRRNRRLFMRLDGVLNGTEEFSPDITELVSHFHNDHISYAALENLLDAFAENEKKRNEAAEQNAVLERYVYERGNVSAARAYLHENPLPEGGKGTAPDNTTRLLVSVLDNRLRELEGAIQGLEERISGLAAEIIPLPALQADVVKWPHHAHIFTEAKSRDVIIKLNGVVKPRYIIYQAHGGQDLKKFEGFIKGFDFSGEFINSAVKPVRFISLRIPPAADRYYPLPRTGSALS